MIRRFLLRAYFRLVFRVIHRWFPPDVWFDVRKGAIREGYFTADELPRVGERWPSRPSRRHRPVENDR